MIVTAVPSMKARTATITYPPAPSESSEEAPKNPSVTHSYMSHHVGMSIVAAQNALFGDIVRKRFISYPEAGSTADLLKEKIPLDPKMIKTKNIMPGISSEKYAFDLRIK